MEGKEVGPGEVLVTGITLVSLDYTTQRGTNFRGVRGFESSSLKLGRKKGLALNTLRKKCVM